jgi:solute carrier family 6 GABA transporter-like protein 1
VRLLFLDLLLLGLDSGFSLLEAFTTVLEDTIYFKDTPKHILLLVPTVVGWLLSIIYCSDAGYTFLDAIDFYINFVMIVVGFFEAFGSGWVYGMVHQMELLGTAPVVSYVCANFLSVFVACGLWFGVDIDNAAWSGFAGLICTYLAFLAVTAYYLKARLAQDDLYTWKSIWWELGFGNIIRLRNRITPMLGPVPFVWCFLIKQFIPHVLIILFINLARSKTGDGDPIFGGYGGYEVMPYQVLGILTVVFALVLVIIGAVFPKLYEPLAMPQVADYENTDGGAAASTGKKMSKEPCRSDAEKGDASEEEEL